MSDPDGAGILIPLPAPAQLLPAQQSQARPKPRLRAKRSRTMGPPFRVILYAQSGRKIDVSLEIPSEGEECPLTLGPICDDSLDFLQPTTTWFISFPEVKKAVLPCGHSFGALNILYHFARRNMLCPCCRAGLDSRLAYRCIPPLFRNLMESKILREIRSDAEELIESDRRAASGLQAEAASASGIHAEAASLVYLLDTRFLDLVMSGSLSLDVRFYSYNEQRPPLATMNMPLLAHVNHSDMERAVFTLPRGSISDFISHQLRDPSVCAVDFTVIVEADLTNDSIRVATTRDQIRLDRQINMQTHVVNAEGGSVFRMEFQEGYSRISNFEWSVPMSYFNNLHQEL